MSTEDNKNIARKQREAYNTNNMDLLGETLAASFVAHDMLPNVPQTLEGARCCIKATWLCFPMPTRAPTI